MNLKKLKVKEYLENKKGKIITVNPEMSARDVSNIFAEKNITGAPVVNKDNEVVGVVSITDITRSEGIIELRGLIDLIFLNASEEIQTRVQNHLNENYSELTVKELMTPGPVVASPEDSIEDIVKIMIQNKIRRVIITRNNRVAGIITVTDILNLILEN